jgi:hypothetical protein
MNKLNKLYVSSTGKKKSSSIFIIIKSFF